MSEFSTPEEGDLCAVAEDGRKSSVDNRTILHTPAPMASSTMARPSRPIDRQIVNSESRESYLSEVNQETPHRALANPRRPQSFVTAFDALALENNEKTCNICQLRVYRGDETPPWTDVSGVDSQSSLGIINVDSMTDLSASVLLPERPNQEEETPVAARQPNSLGTTSDSLGTVISSLRGLPAASQKQIPTRTLFSDSAATTAKPPKNNMEFGDMFALALGASGGDDASVHEVMLGDADLEQLDDEFSDIGDFDMTAAYEEHEADQLNPAKQKMFNDSLPQPDSNLNFSALMAVPQVGAFDEADLIEKDYPDEDFTGDGSQGRIYQVEPQQKTDFGMIELEKIKNAPGTGENRLTFDCQNGQEPIADKPGNTAKAGGNVELTQNAESSSAPLDSIYFHSDAVPSTLSDDTTPRSSNIFGGDTVYLDEHGEGVTDLAYSYPLRGSPTNPFESVTHPGPADSSGTFATFGDAAGFDNMDDTGQFLAAENALEKLAHDEDEFQKENIFIKDDVMKTSDRPAEELGDSWAIKSNVTLRPDTPPDQEAMSFMRISIGTFMRERTEALGTLDGRGRHKRPSFGVSRIVTPPGYAPQALISLEEADEHDTDVPIKSLSSGQLGPGLFSEQSNHVGSVQSSEDQHKSQSTLRASDLAQSSTRSSDPLARKITMEEFEVGTNQDQEQVPLNGSQGLNEDPKAKDASVNLSSVTKFIMSSGADVSPDELVQRIMKTSQKKTQNKPQSSNVARETNSTRSSDTGGLGRESSSAANQSKVSKPPRKSETVVAPKSKKPSSTSGKESLTAKPPVTQSCRKSLPPKEARKSAGGGDLGSRTSGVEKSVNIVKPRTTSTESLGVAGKLKKAATIKPHSKIPTLQGKGKASDSGPQGKADTKTSQSDRAKSDNLEIQETLQDEVWGTTLPDMDEDAFEHNGSFGNPNSSGARDSHDLWISPRRSSVTHRHRPLSNINTTNVSVRESYGKKDNPQNASPINGASQDSPATPQNAQAPPKKNRMSSTPKRPVGNFTLHATSQEQLSHIAASPHQRLVYPGGDSPSGLWSGTSDQQPNTDRVTPPVNADCGYFDKRSAEEVSRHSDQGDVRTTGPTNTQGGPTLETGAHGDHTDNRQRHSVNNNQGSWLDVPSEIIMPEVCCVGLSTVCHVPLSNPSSRWLHTSLSVHALSLDGHVLHQPPVTRVPFIMKDKVVVEPRSTEQVKVIFAPRQAGVYVAQLCIGVSPLVSEQGLTTDRSPCMVTIQAVAEAPIVQVLAEGATKLLDFGEVAWGGHVTKPLTLVNRGRCQVPIRMIVSMGQGSHSLFTFEKSVSPVNTSLGRDSPCPPCLTCVTLPPATDSLHIHPQPVHIYFNAPYKQDKGGQLVSEYTASVNIEVDSPSGYTALGSVPLVARAGSAKLHAPRSLELISMEAVCGERDKFTFPVRNAGGITLQVAVEVAQWSEVFKVLPPHLTVPPASEDNITVVFEPLAMTTTSSQLESVVSLTVEPDGPVYEIPLRGLILQPAPTILPEPPLESLYSPTVLTNKQALSWGGVALDQSIGQTVVMKHDGDREFKVRLIIYGNDQVFKMKKVGGSDSSMHCSAMEVTLQPCEELPVHVYFSPAEVATYNGSLKIKPTHGPIAYNIPLCGYGGVSQLVIQNMHTGMGHNNSYWTKLGSLTTKDTCTLKVKVFNKGQRAAYVKALGYQDLGCKTSLPHTVLLTEPAEVCLDAGEGQEFKVDLRPTDQLTAMCRDQAAIVSNVAFFCGDELARHRYIKATAQKTSSTTTSLADHNPVKNIDFTGHFLHETPIKDAVDVRTYPNNIELFYVAMSKMTLALVGEPARLPTMPATMQSTAPVTMQSTAPVTMQSTAPARVNRLANTEASRDVGQMNGGDTTRSAHYASTLPARLAVSNKHPATKEANRPWLVIPEQIMLVAPSPGDNCQMKKIQLINNTDRSLTFELATPSHCLIVSPEHGTIDARNFTCVCVGPCRNLRENKVDLPWQGALYIHIDGKIKIVDVQIHQDLPSQNTAPQMSLPLAPRAGLAPTTSKIQNKEQLLEITPSTLQFADCDSNQKQVLKVKIKNRDMISHKIKVVQPASPFSTRPSGLDILPLHYVRLPVEFCRPKQSKCSFSHYQSPLILIHDSGHTFQVTLLAEISHH